MLDQDRVFLQDFLSLTSKNHMMTVEALFRAGQNGKQLAALTLRRATPALSPSEAEAEEAATNEAGRFQSVMFAKIFAEYVAALEDFGALCHAIRARSKTGILREYLASETSAVGSFFADAIASPDADLGTLLKLPELAMLRTKLSDEVYVVVEQHFQTAAGFVRVMAQTYRLPPAPQGSPALVPLRKDWRECVFILLDVMGDRGGPQGVFPWTFNKIKHRFAVLESVEQYATLPIAKEFEVVGVNKGDHRVAFLVDQTRDASMAAAEIAATLLVLDEHGAL